MRSSSEIVAASADISVPVPAPGPPQMQMLRRARTHSSRNVAIWRDSSATDPTTGESRPISEDLPREIQVHFSQQVACTRLRWGVDVTLASHSPEYYFDEVRIERFGTQLDVFAQYEPSPAWNIRLFANNLTDRSAVRERQIHDGLRGMAPLSYLETRTLNIGPYVGLNVRRTFGT